MKVPNSPNGPIAGPNVQVADLYQITLADGTFIAFSDCDRILTSVPTPSALSGVFNPGTFPPLRVTRGNITWESGVKPSSLTISMSIRPSDKLDLGLSWTIAATRGLLDWAQINVWRAFGNTSFGGNGLFTTNSDGSRNACVYGSDLVRVRCGGVAKSRADSASVL